MRKYIICGLVLIVVAVSYGDLKALCAESFSSRPKTPVNGSASPPLGYPLDFPCVPGGQVNEMPARLNPDDKQVVLIKGV